MIERLIEALGMLDGDADDEPEDDRCTAADDGLAPIWVHGRRYWGASDDG